MSEIRVTDRRMFTPDGRLRESYERELAESANEVPESAAPVEPPPEPEPEPTTVAAQPSSAPELPEVAGALPPLPAEPPPGLFELVDFLAQLALASMGEVPFADGRLTRDLDAARFYIDSIGAIHARYSARLSAQELQFVESYLDQLRLRFVARRG
jgi:hypothetical protein